MPTNEVTIDEARMLITRVAEEVGLIVTENKGYCKIVSPATGHKIYVLNGQRLRKIDCTLDLPPEEEGRETLRLPLKAPNGAIRCHLVPTLDALERGMRMIAAAEAGKREVNRPRPFAAARVPKPVATPVPEIALEPVATVDGQTLGDRLEVLRARGRLARVNRRLENDATGTLTRELAEALEDGRIDESDLAHLPDQNSRDVQAAIESGVEVES